VEVAGAKIVRVERNGVLVLRDGRAARLEGVLLPAGVADRAPDVYAVRAIGRLRDLAAGRTAILAAENPKEDRYGRLRAEVLVSADHRTDWLQQTLLAEGLARVDIAPDRNECAAELYAIEARARDARAGLWADAAYAIRSPSRAARDEGTFQVIQGTVERVTGGARVSLEFGSDSANELSITISSDGLRTFRGIGVDPYSYEGQTVRVRGWIERVHHPEIDVATPSDIQIVRAPILRGSVGTPD
jgi:hypothetical protein